MEQLIYAAVIGAFIGLALRYLLPGRDSYGIALLPAIGAAATCAAWAIVIWLGFTLDGGWIWVVALGAALVLSLVVSSSDRGGKDGEPGGNTSGYTTYEGDGLSDKQGK